MNNPKYYSEFDAFLMDNYFPIIVPVNKLLAEESHWPHQSSRQNSMQKKFDDYIIVLLASDC